MIALSTADLSFIFGAISTALAVYAYMPYFWGMYQGKVRPHAFSWLIGGILSSITFFIQMSGGAGPGAWMTGYTALACFVIFAFSLKHLHQIVKPFDWVCLILSGITIFIWLVIDSALWAMILATLIDVVAFLPTIRKSWARPQDENIQMYLVNVFKFALSIPALSHISWVTILFPLTWVIVNSGFIAFLILRRRFLSRTK